VAPIRSLGKSMIKPPAPRRRLVVFDWDGTIVDSTTAILNSIRGAAGDLSIPVPDADRAAWVIGLGLQDALRHAVPELKPADLPQFIDRYRHHFAALGSQVRPFAGIELLLASLKGCCAIAVATGKSRAGLQSSFEQTGFARYFDASRCADEGEPKPHPWMLSNLCAELQIAPAQTLMIGDTVHDVGMAHAASVDALTVSYGAHKREQLLAAEPADCVGSVTELADRVFKWISQER
jgi:phosphoglycolate phosphatase